MNHIVNRRTAAVTLAMLAIAGPALAQGAAQSTPSKPVDSAGSGHRASKIIGGVVKNERGETLGKVDDLIVTQGRMDAPKIVLGQGNAGNDNVYAVLTVGGFLGINSKLVAVRYDALRLNRDGTSFVLVGVTPEQIKAAPDYVYR